MIKAFTRCLAALMYSGICGIVHGDNVQSCKEVFSTIYKDKIWGVNGEGQGDSGPGSSLRYTAEYRQFVQKFLADNNIKSVVDVGCGDWTFSQTMNWNGIDYKGFDVVESVIEKNKQKFGKSNIQFNLADGTQPNVLPAADLLLCKDVLQHLTLNDVEQFLKNLGQFKYALITNNINPHGVTINSEISRGDYRYLDLTQPPFNVDAEVVLTYPTGPFPGIKQILLIKPPIKKKAG